MNKIIIYICSFIVLSSCGSTHVDLYKQCREQVEAINKMSLYRSYLVPLDSLGQDVCGETIYPDMYDHCELIADKEQRQVSVLATIYFDAAGNVRKNIQHRADGGDLNNVTYYDEQGAIIYSIYANSENDFGRLYSLNSKIYIEHSFSNPWIGNRFLSEISMTTDELAREARVRLQMPDGCKLITFNQIQKGDVAFLCATNVYELPNETVVNSEDIDRPQAWFGRVVYVDSIADGWCRLKVPTLDTPLGYVPVDSLELYVQ